MIIFTRLLVFGLFLAIGQTNAMKRNASDELNRPHKQPRMETKISLLDALREKDVFEFWLALESGANVDEKDSLGYPIIWNVLNGSEFNDQDKDLCFDLLVKENVDLDALTSSRFALLHEAASSVNVKLVEKLIRANARVNIQDSELWTPLHLICASKKSSDDIIEIVKLLVNAGAPLNAQNLDGNTPLHLAANKKAVASYLVSMGADYEIHNDDEETPYDYSWNEHQKTNPSLKNRSTVRKNIFMPALSSQGNLFKLTQERQTTGKPMSNRQLTLPSSSSQ